MSQNYLIKMFPYNQFHSTYLKLSAILSINIIVLSNKQLLNDVWDLFRDLFFFMVELCWSAEMYISVKGIFKNVRI